MSRWIILAVIGAGLLAIGAKSEPTLSLDQTAPHVGDALTFATDGGKYVSVACYDGGLVSVEVQKVGETFHATAVGSCVAALDKDDEQGNGALAYVWFEVLP